MTSITRFSRSLALALAAAATACAAQPGPTVAGCPAFPPDNVWNTRVDKLPVDPLSPKLVATIGAEKSLHPVFGAAPPQSPPWGIPFNIIPGDQQRVRVQFDYRGETDLSNYPVPPKPAME